MTIIQNHHRSIVSLIFIGALFMILLSSYQASAKSRHPISENEIRAKKNQCYEDVGSGMWGQRCMSSNIAKENCALQCLSSACYQLIYESDPLEEGEKDFIRGQEFKYCLHNRGRKDVEDSYRIRIHDEKGSIWFAIDKNAFAGNLWERAWTALKVPTPISIDNAEARIDLVSLFLWQHRL